MSRDTHILNPDSRNELGEGASPDPGGDADLFDWLPRLVRPRSAWTAGCAWIPGRTASPLAQMDRTSDRRRGLNRESRGALASSGWAARPDRSVDRAPAGNSSGRMASSSARPPRCRPPAWIRSPVCPEPAPGSRRLSGESGRSSSSRIESLDAGATNQPDRQQASQPCRAERPDTRPSRTDAFDPTGLGSIVTVRWPVQLGTSRGCRAVVGSRIGRPALARLATEHDFRRAASGRADADERAGDGLGLPPPYPRRDCRRVACFAGHVAMPQGLSRRGSGSLLTFSETRLTGSRAAPRAGRPGH